MNITQCRAEENLCIKDLGDKDASEALVGLKEALRDPGPWEVAIAEPGGMLLIRGARGMERCSHAIYVAHLGTQGDTRQETVEALSMLGAEAQVTQPVLEQYPFGCVFALNREVVQYYPIS